MGTETYSPESQLAEEFEQFGQAERNILAAAVQVFARKGFDGARTDEIAAKAGVNKAMIYYYFKSKENLYTVIVETLFEKIYLILSRHLFNVNVTTPEEGILSFINSYMDFIYAHRIFLRVMLWDLAGGGQIVSRVAGRVIGGRTDQVVVLFKQAAREGHLRPLNPKHLAVSMMGMILFFFFAEPVIRVIWGEEPITPEHIAERKNEISNLILYGILPKQG